MWPAPFEHGVPQQGVLRTFLTEVCPSIRYPEKIYHEDHYFSLYTYFAARKILRINEYLYAYVTIKNQNERRSVRLQSATHLSAHKNALLTLSYLHQIYRFLVEQGQMRQAADPYLYHYLTCFNLLLPSIGKSGKQKAIREVQDIVQTIMTHYPPSLCYFHERQKSMLTDLIRLSTQDFITRYEEGQLEAALTRIKQLETAITRGEHLLSVKEFWLQKINFHRVRDRGRIARYLHYTTATLRLVFAKVLIKIGHKVRAAYRD